MRTVAKPKKAKAAKKAAKATKKKKRVAPKRATPSLLVASLAEASWLEADTALAEALVEFETLKAAPRQKARDDAMALLGQALTRAARKRGLTPLGAAGARERFDAMRHEIHGSARKPKNVQVVTPGVARGGDVLIRARVSAARARRA